MEKDVFEDLFWQQSQHSSVRGKARDREQLWCHYNNPGMRR